MKGTEKNRSGQYLVIAILIVAVAAAIGTRLMYAPLRPASLSATVANDLRVVANFSPEAGKIVRVGMRATVGIDGSRFTGRVTSRDSSRENTFVITLVPPPSGESIGKACQAVVDTSIAPERLKDD